MKTVHTTDNKALITGVAALSASLAFLTVKAVEAVFGIHLNGNSAEVMGSVTVVYHAVLTYLGVVDEPAKPSEPKPDVPPSEKQ